MFISRISVNCQLYPQKQTGLLKKSVSCLLLSIFVVNIIIKINSQSKKKNCVYKNERKIKQNEKMRGKRKNSSIMDVLLTQNYYYVFPLKLLLLLVAIYYAITVPQFDPPPTPFELGR